MELTQIQQGLYTAFIDKNNSSNNVYKPQFISNNYKEGRKVLSTIESELRTCDEFCFSVAFITMSGVVPLLPILKELEYRNIPGKILTTDYLSFTDPKALDKLSSFSNIELKMYSVDEAKEDFHTKGYIFRKKDIYKVIVGSSNLTLSALTKNREWNTKIVSTQQGEYVDELLNEFDELWNSDYSLTYDCFIENYRSKFEYNKKQRITIATNTEYISTILKPNSMQQGFVKNMMDLVNNGENRALLISATGTGKTYASAFALKEINPKKALFIVHREQIAKQAIESYKKVFGKSKTFGLLSGNSKSFDADYLFSTMQMMAKEDIMHKFKQDEFDVIVIDEAHRVGANSYQNITKYFTPKFWLGMTASPERMDEFDVYQAFDHNVAYEIRLQRALEEDLLCPFHYFGISDFKVDDEEMDYKEFKYLLSDDRVEHIINQIEYYGYSGERVKGLIFCSSNKECEELSARFNERGYQTLDLSGEDNQEKREWAIERLVSDDIKNKLDYIFTRDIFNEGVDIPDINQVVMLRPTESPVVFVQQLGRGLRKAKGKDYVVILDFIGNYKNNFMIPIALSGDRSYNKDNIRRYVLEGNRVIPGSSTIHFDEVSQKKIFAAIDEANFNDIKLIKENYKNLKYKLGKIPALMDFDAYGEMDVLRIFDNKSLGSYYKYLVKYEKEYKVRLTEEEALMIEFISKKLANGKRVQELELLSIMLEYPDRLFKRLKDVLFEKYKIELTDKMRTNIYNVMTNEFPTGTGKNTYSLCVFLQYDGFGDACISEAFDAKLHNNEFKYMLKELIEFGIRRYQLNYSNRYKDTDLVLYQKYTYEDACRLLNWQNGEVALNIGGYKFDAYTKTFPVFINYDKDEQIQDTIKYEDRFITPSHLIAISKQGRTLLSEDIQKFLNAVKMDINVELFVRKNKEDKISKEFYYLGRMVSTGEAKEFTMANTDKTAVEIGWYLDTPVREDIYQYIVNR